MDWVRRSYKMLDHIWLVFCAWSDVAIACLVFLYIWPTCFILPYIWSGEASDCVECRDGAELDPEGKNCVVTDWTKYDESLKKEKEEEGEEEGDEEKEEEDEEEEEDLGAKVVEELKEKKAKLEKELGFKDELWLIKDRRIVIDLGTKKTYSTEWIEKIAEKEVGESEFEHYWQPLNCLQILMEYWDVCCITA